MPAPPDRRIVREVYRTAVLLGAGSDLLTVIGSWGDSLPDDEVLAGLAAWNEATAAEVKARIEHAGRASGCGGCSPGVAPRTSPTAP